MFSKGFEMERHSFMDEPTGLFDGIPTGNAPGQIRKVGGITSVSGFFDYGYVIHGEYLL
jgi:hypothetical protein